MTGPASPAPSMLKSMPQTSPEITQLTTRVAYENRLAARPEDTVRRARWLGRAVRSCRAAEFAIVVVPWQDGCVTMVEQYRYPIRQRLWELPMGTLRTRERHPWNKPPRPNCGRRPGWSPRIWAFISQPVSGRRLQCNQVGHFFLATGLTQGTRWPAKRASRAWPAAHSRWPRSKRWSGPARCKTGSRWLRSACCASAGLL